MVQAGRHALRMQRSVLGQEVEVLQNSFGAHTPPMQTSSALMQSRSRWQSGAERQVMVVASHSVPAGQFAPGPGVQLGGCVQTRFWHSQPPQSAGEEQLFGTQVLPWQRFAPHPVTTMQSRPGPQELTVAVLAVATQALPVPGTQRCWSLQWLVSGQPSSFWQACPGEASPGPPSPRPLVEFVEHAERSAARHVARGRAAGRTARRRFLNTGALQPGPQE
jgi:hypothetical protein